MTLKEILANSAGKYPDKTFLRFKTNGSWKTRTFSEFRDRVRNVSEFLHKVCNVRPGDRVALMSENGPEWAEAYFGIISLSAIAVPIDIKLREQEIAHIISDSGASNIILGVRQYSTIRDMQSRLHALRHVTVITGEKNLELPDKVHHAKYHDFDKLMEAHKKHSQASSAAFNKYTPIDDDVASIIYTSGTTGRQKGVMLTHKNFSSNFNSLDAAIEILPTDNFLVILPLHHAFAFTTCLVTPLAAGIEISFVESLKTISENMREVSPTALLGVPLLFEKMYGKFMDGIRENKAAHVLWTLGIRAPIRKSIADKLGGKIRLIVSGGAPADPDMLKGLDELELCPREGYGITECSPVLTLNPYDRSKPKSCGKVLPGVEMCVMNPNSEGIGELAAKGDNVMKGYYKNPEATQEAFHDGWFLTGDMGYIDNENFVYITGRKKALIVNREGKNIYPEEVEIQLNKSAYILECLVVGYREADENVGEHVGVIVVPDKEALDTLQAKEKRNYTDKEIETLLRSEVKQYAQGIAEYKRPRRIQIRWEEFNKTSTGKAKRYLYSMGSTQVD